MSNKKLIDMNNTEALLFFLKASSYCNVKLPLYYNFQTLLYKIHNDYPNRTLKDFYKAKNKARDYNDINYELLVNKSGSLSWRKLTLINPIAYVAIVQEMCREDNWKLIINRFNEFKKNNNIKCCSIPCESTSYSTDKKEQILNWWTEFEQKTIGEALNYKMMIITDISNCYPSIYTHSIPWALHGKDVIKNNIKTGNKTKYFGDKLDSLIRDISYGQTNGIPQGSVLSDFIAEIVLGYCDLLLSSRLDELHISDYKILRYRDDYRILCNNEKELDTIFKELTRILFDFNLQINSNKTLKTNDILSNSLKKDKVYGLLNPIDRELSIQKELFAIREISLMYKNSGLIVKMLHTFYKDRLLPAKQDEMRNVEQIVSIVIDIMLNNSRVYPECIAILSKVLFYSAQKNKIKYIDIIKKKVENSNNSDYLKIWLQRLSLKNETGLKFDSPLCKLVFEEEKIWNNDWSNYKIDTSSIIDSDKVIKMSEVVTIEEIDDFLTILY